jgi:glycosyltransferase involved in cell wall biosynthesis
MHIVLLNTEFSMNGAALLLFRWAEHLAKAGHRITGVHQAAAEGPLRDAYLAIGAELTERCVVDRNMVAVCNTLMAAPYVQQVAGAARTIWWIHEGEISLGLLASNPNAIAAFRRAHAIILPSAAIRDRVYRSYLFGVPEQRVHIVPPGIDPIGAPSRDPGPAPPERPVRLISVGSVYPRKRQADLIRAVTRLVDLPIECLLVGKVVKLEDDAVQLARQDPKRIKFAGELPHARAMQLLDRADIFALPSGSECLPLAPLEAGLRGKAVVLSDLPAHEGVWRHGMNCLMHPVSDVDLLTHMLRILATDGALRDRLGAAGRRTASGFRSDVCLARLDTVLTGLQ